jgi:rubrerythrin
LASELHPPAAADPLPRQWACDACGYEAVEFRPLPHCPMCGAVAGAVWQDGVLVAASAA